MRTEWQRHVLASSGYLELGMFDAAALVLEEIAPEDKTRNEVLGARVDIYMAAKNSQFRRQSCRAIPRYQTIAAPEELTAVRSSLWECARIFVFGGRRSSSVYSPGFLGSPFRTTICNPATPAVPSVGAAAGHSISFGVNLSCGVCASCARTTAPPIRPRISVV